MNKVGIITFHAAHNYGSVLQSYALQKTIISNCNIECEIIDYETENQRNMYSIFKKNNSIKSIFNNILSIINYNMLNRRYKEFEKFSDDKLKKSTLKYRNLDELRNIGQYYDTLVCGSDQIWNTSAYDFEEAYFLTFNKGARKIAYAPSLGGYNPLNNEMKKNKVTKYLSDFYKISVRENSAKDVISKLTNKNVDVVLDPTFLLEKNDWDKLIENDGIEKDYIFFYSIDYSDDSIEIAKKISNILGLPVVILYTINKTYKTVGKGFNISKECGPGDFLNLIKNAKLVLSTSFHGTVFSIIYRKDFFVLRKRNENGLDTDDRLTTLLGKCNIKNREINVDNIDLVKKNLHIDYSEAEMHIQNERRLSLEYLINSINEKDEYLKNE